MINHSSQATVTEPPGATESGIIPWSWKGWKNEGVQGSIYLFIEGYAAPDPITERINTTDSYGDKIAALYERKGNDFVKYLRGSFAVVLWDARSRKLILATDHFGTRPLYYAKIGSRVAFAPRMSWFAAASEIDKAVDPNSLYFYLNHSFIPAPFTIYKNIRRLEPGHALIRKSGTSTVKRYWDIVYEEKQNLDESTAAADLRESVQNSVRFASN